MIEEWSEVSSEKIAGAYGKEMRRVLFNNPSTGQEEEFYLFGQKDWSIVFAVTHDLQVITTRQFKQGCKKIITELPAGTADFSDETPEQTARRELLEETGYKANNMIFLGPPLWMASRNSWTRFFPFLATGCKKVCSAKIDSSEEIETQILPLREWQRMCLEEIEDAASVVATFRGSVLL